MKFESLRRLLPGSEVDDASRVAADDPLAAEHELLAALIEEGERVYGGRTSRDEAVEWGNDGFAVANLTASKPLDRLDAAGQDRLVAALIQRLTPLDQAAAGIVARSEVNHWSFFPPGFVEVWHPRMLLYSTLKRLIRRDAPPLAAGSWAAVARWCASAVDPNPYWVPVKPLLDVAEGLAQTPAGLDEELAAALTELGQSLRTTKHNYLETYRWADRIETLTGQKPPLQPGEAWSDAALAWLNGLTPDRRAAWTALLSHCRNATGSRPNAAWRKETGRLLKTRVSFAEVKERALAWLPLVSRPRTDTAQEVGRRWSSDWIIDLHQDLLRGFVWLCARAGEDRDLARALAALTAVAYRKGHGGGGVRAVRVGNACVYVLGAMPGHDAIGHLARLRVKEKFGTAQREIAKALEAVAARENLPADEIEEMAVPDYGMTEVGRLTREFGDNRGFAAELTVTGAHTTELLWRNLQTGKTQGAVPAAIKSAHPEELREFKAAAKDLHAMLPAQAQRLDALFLQRRRWPLATWRERYLDHPLVGTLARRLIWKFHRGDEETPFAVGLWLDNTMRDRRGQPLTLDDATDTVTLWHPLDAGDAPVEITAWRGWLEEHEIRQPFKQAHREVYLLTPAEERTGTYSNRFAAHLLKQHQFHALCAARGWRNRLRLMVDDTYPPASRTLAAWGLRAEYWVEGVGGEHGQDLTDSGAFRYLATDQVRFYPLNAPQMEAQAGGGGYGPAWRNRTAADTPLPLTDVPPLVFSEIMRDVDLFVGVASVGNDPAWGDGGPGGRHRDYWAAYSFGDLSATAHTRRDALGRLVPRLKIAARCSFTDRFLVVRGELRTYKIHLGSGNILMSPDDRYLCIVPGAAGADAEAGPKVFLPFEGDRTLSVILSKAFLLAADDRITDPTITRQIRA